jgi:uncharacterized protein YkwD
LSSTNIKKHQTTAFCVLRSAFCVPLSAFCLLLFAFCLPSWTNAGGYSQEKGAGVAGGGRVSRGKNDSARPERPTPRYSQPEADIEAEDESKARGLSRRFRDIESLEQQCLDEVNRVRRRNGLQRLVLYEELLPVAREYSRRMAEQNFFSHNDPEGRSVRERVDEADIRWRMVGENLAYSNGYVNPVAASIHGWMGSPGHRANILEPDFRLTAIGVWIRHDGTVYFTEIFLKQ